MKRWGRIELSFDFTVTAFWLKSKRSRADLFFGVIRYWHRDRRMYTWGIYLWPFVVRLWKWPADMHHLQAWLTDRKEVRK